MSVDSRNVAVAKVLGVSESEKTLSLDACAAKSLPGGLQDSSKTRARIHGEGRERLLSFSFHYTVYSYQLTSGQVGQVTGAVTRVYTPLGRWPRRIRKHCITIHGFVVFH